MPRGPRSVLPDGFYHATGRGTARGTIFGDDFDCRAFVERLHTVAGDFKWDCYAYCLMINHYHLVVKALRADLSAGMHRLNGLHAQRFNRRYDRTGHLFQGRFGAFAIEDEEHLHEACRYVFDNPVRAGFCERADDWPWSGGLVPVTATR